MTTTRKLPAARRGREPNPDGVPRDVFYPERDGKPMAETEVHLFEMMRLILTLVDWFAARLDVYVVGNMLLYYEEGNPRASISPDVMVAFGVPKGPPRRIYKVWEEGTAPGFVLEVTSLSTRREDRGKKRALYARLGVREYVLYDPLAEYLHPPLQGYRLVGADYQAVIAEPDGALVSETLGARLALVEGRPRLRDARTGADLLSPQERAAAETERADAESERANAEAERANAEAERANAEAERADAEAVARRAAEARIAQLEALLASRAE